MHSMTVRLANDQEPLCASRCQHSHDHRHLREMHSQWKQLPGPGKLPLPLLEQLLPPYPLLHHWLRLLHARQQQCLSQVGRMSLLPIVQDVVIHKANIQTQHSLQSQTGHHNIVCCSVKIMAKALHSHAKDHGISHECSCYKSDL